MNVFIVAKNKDGNNGNHKPEPRQVWKPAILLLIMVLAMSGCVFKVGELPPTATATEKPAPEQAGLQPSDTPRPVDTATLAPTDTPEVVSVAIVNVDLIKVYEGPAKTYPVIAEITYGEVLRILGRNMQKTWLYVLIPDDRAGWILVEEVEGNFDLDNLPVIQFEPTPTATKTGEPYGGAILVPPDLDGVSPASARNPVRSALAMVAVVLVLAWMLAVNTLTAVRKRPARAHALARLFQIIISSF